MLVNQNPYLWQEIEMRDARDELGSWRRKEVSSWNCLTDEGKSLLKQVRSILDPFVKKYEQEQRHQIAMLTYGVALLVLVAHIFAGLFEICVFVCMGAIGAFFVPGKVRDTLRGEISFKGCLLHEIFSKHRGLYEAFEVVELSLASQIARHFGVRQGWLL